MELKRIDDDEYSWGTPYYNPEAYGCELAVSVDCGASYSFDMFVVLRTVEDKSKTGLRKGTLLYATDSGCSCPSPFDRAEWTQATKAEVIRAFDAWSAERPHTGWGSGMTDSYSIETRNRLYAL